MPPRRESRKYTSPAHIKVKACQFKNILIRTGSIPILNSFKKCLTVQPGRFPQCGTYILTILLHNNITLAFTGIGFTQNRKNSSNGDVVVKVKVFVKLFGLWVVVLFTLLLEPARMMYWKKEKEALHSSIGTGCTISFCTYENSIKRKLQAVCMKMNVFFLVKVEKWKFKKKN